MLLFSDAFLHLYDRVGPSVGPPVDLISSESSQSRMLKSSNQLATEMNILVDNGCKCKDIWIKTDYITK